MKWFKHDADAHRDAKLKRLIMKYGMEGYGLYWHCIELIAGAVDQNNITFELEHDAEIIAHDTGIHYELVQEMMTHMVNLRLFESANGVITCMKLAKRLDQSMTSNPELRKVINGLRDNGNTVGLIESSDSHDSVMIESEQNRLEQNRSDKKRKNTNGQIKEFDRFWSAYPRKVKKLQAKDVWKRKNLDNKIQEIIADIQWRTENDPQWKDSIQFIPHPTTYLRAERWEDEADEVS